MGYKIVYYRKVSTDEWKVAAVIDYSAPSKIWEEGTVISQTLPEKLKESFIIEGFESKVEDLKDYIVIGKIVE